MKKNGNISNPQFNTGEPENKESFASTYGLSRRKFLGGTGGVTALAMAAGAMGLPPLLAGQSSEAQAAPPDLKLDDVLDNAKANRRGATATKIRIDAAHYERQQGMPPHLTNGDEELYPNRIGNFSKTLPHNDLGEVDPQAYQDLLDALKTGRFEDFEAIPAGGIFPLLNPMGGMGFNIEGPDSAAITVNSPPPLASAELAAQAAELYWMALLRDIPFTEWDSHPLVQQAADDLSKFPGYTGPRDPVTGEVTPQDLFRVDYPGVMDGPMVSQFCLQPFVYDGIRVEQRIRNPLLGTDFLTDFQEWLHIQRGGFPSGGFSAPFDPTPRFIRNCRDLGQNAGQDTIYSQYFKAALMLGFLAPVDKGNPYRRTGPGFGRQLGFASFGLPHLLELIGLAPKSERHAWYQKWNVHRFLRPEAYSGRVHNLMTGAADYPIHEALLNSSVLPLIYEYNRLRNKERGLGDQGTYLLPQMFPIGSPSHPSFPAGHAISAGACVTILKAWVDEETPIEELFEPMKPNKDGTKLVPYDGPPLTLGGELNKLAYNLSLGRDMSGVHWRADDIEGNRQGEEVAIRILRELRATYIEPFEGFSLTKFDGTTITV